MPADAASGSPESSLWHARDNEKSSPEARTDSIADISLAFRRTLITGGGGFVGQYLRAALERKLPGADLISTTRKTTALNTEHWVAVDLTDGSSVNALAKEYRPDLVVHLAAQSSPSLSAKSCAETWRANVGGAITLAEALANHSPRVTLLNVSSAEVYGQTFLDGPVTEHSVLRPLSVYGKTKAAAETIFDDILPDSARLITVRPFNHTGPGQDDRFVVPSLAAQIARIERGEQAPPLRVGNLDAERDFLDVRDVVRAYTGLIEQARSLPMRSVFNIASARAIRISEILSRLLAIARRAIPVEQDLALLRTADIPCAVGNASAIHNATGWIPEIDFNQTLHDVLEAMR